MAFLPGDIIVRAYGEKSTLWVSERLLVEAGVNELILRVTFRSRYKRRLTPSQQREMTRHDAGTWRWAKINGRFYYDYDRVPDRPPRYFRSRLPGKNELMEAYNNLEAKSAADGAEMLRQELKKRAGDTIDRDDILYYMQNYQGILLGKGKAEQLAMAASLCGLIREYHAGSGYRAFGITRDADYWDITASLTRELSLEGLRVKTPGALRKKILYELPEGNRAMKDALVSNLYGNQNRRVFGREKLVDIETGEIMNFDYHEVLVYNAWMNPGKSNKFRKVQVYDDYVRDCKGFDIDPVSFSAVKHYLKRFSNRSLMSLERDGSDHFNNTYKPYIPAGKPTMASSMWCADFSGTKLLFRYWKETWRSGKKVRELKVGSWYMFRLIDVATDCIVGWSLTTNGEDYEKMLPGIKMAVDLNDGHAARELVTDNGPAFTSKTGMSRLQLLFDRHRRISVGNKQANRAEPYVRMLSDKGRKFDNWSRLGFYSRHEDNISNPDYLDIQKLPWREESISQVEELVNEWNNTARPDGTVPLVEFSKPERRNPDLKPVDQVSYRFMFGRHTKTSLARCRGIMLLSNRTDGVDKEHKFEFNDWVQDMVTIDNALYGRSSNLDVKVVWDETGADIYTPGDDPAFIMSLKPAGLAHATYAEATEESTGNLARYTEKKKRFEKEANRLRDDVVRGIELVNSVSEDDLDVGYLQLAALSGGKSKEQFNRMMENKMPERRLEDDHLSDEDIENNLLSQL